MKAKVSKKNRTDGQTDKVACKRSHNNKLHLSGPGHIWGRAAGGLALEADHGARPHHDPPLTRHRAYARGH